MPTSKRKPAAGRTLARRAAARTPTRKPAALRKPAARKPRQPPKRPAGAEAVFLGHHVQADIASDSDHNAILFSFGAPHCREPITLLAWNILCRLGYNEEYGFPFDGFNRRFESDVDYTARLRRTAAEVMRHCRAKRPCAVLLQECPEPGETGHEEFIAELTRCMQPLGYTVLTDGEFVTAVLAKLCPSTVALPELQRQKRTIHAAHWGDGPGGVVVLNVHLLWDKEGSENAQLTRSDLLAAVGHCAALHPGAVVVLAGDTNRVPAGPGKTDAAAATIEELSAGLGVLCRPPGPTNVRWNGAEGRSEMTYADFALLFSQDR